jgi:putative DNA primase/helicase
VISALVGPNNVAEQSVTKLGKDFGLEALLGKQVLLVPDLRLGKDSNVGGITETLLNISGEDRVSVGVKFKSDVQTKLNTRIVLFSNLELLLPDQSGALNRRLFPFVMRKSFYGREDVTLGDRLMDELPEILTWAVAGLRRLESRRRDDGTPAGFVLTDDGREVVQGIAKRTSPVKSFLSHVCELGEDFTVEKDTLYEAFEGWCVENEIQSSYVRETFSKDLRAASGYNVTPLRIRMGDGARAQVYKGVKMKAEFEGYVWEKPTEDF